MESQAEQLESEINRKTNLLSDAQQFGETTWKDIQSQLKDNEAAIEFSSFRYHNGKKWTDTIQYTALVLRKEDKQPVLIPLFTQKDFDEAIKKTGSKPNQLYRGFIAEATGHDLNKLYELVWKPLEEYLNEGETIHFAPSGTLHQIAFSAIKTPDGKYLSDKYDLREVSTTAKLLDKNKIKSLGSVILFGGIDYDANEKALTQKVNT